MIIIEIEKLIVTAPGQYRYGAFIRGKPEICCKAMTKEEAIGKLIVFWEPQIKEIRIKSC